MVRKKELFGIALVALVCLLLIALYQRDPSPLIRSRPATFQAIQIEDDQPLEEHSSKEDIINAQRSRLRKELYGFKFPSNLSLANFTIEDGGQPIRTIIFSTWRSGSTFLGDVLNALPGNYYHYEPLMEYEIMQIRGPPDADSALTKLKSLLNCEYKNLYRYIEYATTHNYLFTHNKRLWAQCEANHDICWDPDFLNRFCRLFPFQSVKTVRLRLKLAEALLEVKSLNVKIILLIRDPRGTLQSRKHRDWCPGEPDCDQPDYLCSDMVSDYSAAIKLKELYPSRFRALRYEDLSLNPYEIVEDVFNFMGITLHPQIRNFLDSHTTINVGGVSSTYRDSKSAPFHWKNDLNYTEIQSIEAHCKEAMHLWGYVRTESSNLKDFYPLATYDIK